MMKSLRRVMLERLVARRPRQALQLAAGPLRITAVQMQLSSESPLYQGGGGEAVELPLDEVIAPYVLQHGRWQTEELQFISALAPTQPCILVDVGANVGLIARQLVHSLPQIVSAVCYEPHPGNFLYLQRNLAHLSQCHPVQAALGVQEGELKFYEELQNSGNYSLNPDAMRGKQFRTSSVRCLRATESQLLAPLSPEQRTLPVIWKSDTQGFDESIMTTLPDAFWKRVQCGVMEIWRIERPHFDRARFAAILEQFAVRSFAGLEGARVSVSEVLEYAAGVDYGHQDLYFARERP